MRAGIILPALLLLLLTPFNVFADASIQTDWSGGPGVPGPVTDWGNEYYLSSYINYLVVPGTLQLAAGVTEQAVCEYIDCVRAMHPGDIDGDGDIDVVAAASTQDCNLIWFANADGAGTSWDNHVIETGYQGASCIQSADIDGDGDLDVISSMKIDALNDCTRWYRNEDGEGASWTGLNIDGNFDGCWSVFAADVDDDGDLDVLGASHVLDEIAWWENEDGTGTSWTRHLVTSGFDGAWSVHSVDLDGDGDMDVIGTARNADDVAWWENEDGSGTSWTGHVVDEDFDGARAIFTIDIDSDGDRDVLATADGARLITCWENADGLGTSWTEHGVGTDVCALSVFPNDLDGDDDMDILVSDFQAGEVLWFENKDGAGSFWQKHTVTGGFTGAIDAYAADVNGEGTMDILGAAYGSDRIAWWDLSVLSPEGSLESSILDLQADPDWDYIEWNALTPPGTSVSLQVRASDDQSSMGAWSDTLTSPGLLGHLLADGCSYLQYRVILKTADPGMSPTLMDVMLTWDPMGVVEGEDPLLMALLPFSPNPSPAPVVRFSLPGPAPVGISVFDLTGRLVSEIHETEYATGYHDAVLGDLSPGIYFCRMISGEFAAARCFVVVE